MGRLESGATHMGRWRPMTFDPTTTAMQLMATRIVDLERRNRSLEEGIHILDTILHAYMRHTRRTGKIVEDTGLIDALEAFTHSLDDLGAVIREVVPSP